MHIYYRVQSLHKYIFSHFLEILYVDFFQWFLASFLYTNEFWKLCAVVITTRYQLGNLYANAIGLGLISLPIPHDLVAMGMPNSSLSNFYFYLFLLFWERTWQQSWGVVTSPQLKKARSEEGCEGRSCNLGGQVQLDFKLVWSNELLLRWLHCQQTGTHGAEAQVVREGCLAELRA